MASYCCFVSLVGLLTGSLMGLQQLWNAAKARTQMEAPYGGTNPYDRGVVLNLTAVFGSSPLSWVLPIPPSPPLESLEEEGLRFPLGPHVSRIPTHFPFDLPSLSESAEGGRRGGSRYRPERDGVGDPEARRALLASGDMIISRSRLMSGRLLPGLPIEAPSVLLPKEGVDPKKWAIIACDQYTSEADYWEKVSKFVGKAPSTLKLIFPEVYLESGKDDSIIKDIYASMQEYEDKKILQAKPNPGMVLIERTCGKTATIPGAKRNGVLLAIDLEEYEFKPGNQASIRATEKTIIERIPPRLKVRRGASVELPHILVLIDDPKKTVIEPLLKKTAKMKKIYDFELMENGGHLKGHFFDDESIIGDFAKSLKALEDPDLFAEKYGLSAAQKKSMKPMLFAVGDGNHSLATAKALWDEVKKDVKKKDWEGHPTRYALVELENIHDPSLEFEPIHRLIFGAAGGAKKFVDEMMAGLEKLGYGPVSLEMGPKAFTAACGEAAPGGGATGGKSPRSPKSPRAPSPKRARAGSAASVGSKGSKGGKKGVQGQSFGVMFNGEIGAIHVSKPSKVLTVATMMDFVDPYLASNKNTKIDYVHGMTAIERFCGKKGGDKEGNVGLVLPGMSKGELFKTVILDGVLPRKTFSMGNADEKRFYFECRKIRPEGFKPAAKI